MQALVGVEKLSHFVEQKGETREMLAAPTLIYFLSLIKMHLPMKFQSIMITYKLLICPFWACFKTFPDILKLDLPQSWRGIPPRQLVEEWQCR